MKKDNSCQQKPIAIIGIGCIFPDSPDAKAFLNLLTRGRSAIADPPETHRHLRDFFDSDPKKADHIYCIRGGFLPQVDFDPTEFGIPPAALEATDTSQLLGLLVAKRAISDAGYGDGAKAFDRAKTSVLLGVTGTQELAIPLGARLGHPIWRKALADSGISKETAEAVVKIISDSYVSWQENSFPGLLGNVVAGRIANRLDLGGTNCVVDAACASSMSALHMAILELTTGRADMVLTGGVDTINDPFMYMCFSKTHILSARGELRPFSQEADGTVLGEGIGMVVLKRLEDAQRDDDRVYAVIKGIGSASDGKSQSIYSPRQSGQVLALKRAYDNAGVDPGTIELIEAHGTGTRVGDQVEFKALCEVFGSRSLNGNRCALGSVKSNIGHTKAAAGTAGLIKTALSLYHKVLPPTLKAQPTDNKLGLEHSPFYLNHGLRPWTSGGHRQRRAGVSAFGFGGSNFHAVLEEHKAQKQEPSWDGSVEIVAFSAPTQKALADLVRSSSEKISLESDAHTIARWAASSRRQFNPRDAHRAIMVLVPADDARHVRDCCLAAQDQLSNDSRKTISGAANAVFIGHGPPQGDIAFLFPGQGSQYPGMGRDLICCFPSSLEAFQEVEQHLEAEHTLSEYIYPRLPGETAAYSERLRKTDIAQPAIGAVSAAMLEALAYFGIVPSAACGHSYGELVALHAAGRIDRATLCGLSIARGRFMAQAGAGDNDPGSMLAVSAPIEELDRLAAASGPEMVLANRNSPHQGVLSGATSAIETAEKACQEKGWKTMRLPVAAAFHSSLVSAAQAPFQKVVDGTTWRLGSIHVLSNTTGEPYPPDVAQAKRLLSGQLAKPVDFVSNIERLYAMGVRTFVEVGPKSVLTGLASATLKGKDFQAMAMDRSSGRESGLADLASVLAQLAAMGHGVHLARWEKPIPETSAARMRIRLSGANYRSQKPSVRPYSFPATEANPSGAPKSSIPPIISPTPVISGAGQTEKTTHPGIPSVKTPPHLVSQAISSAGPRDRHPERDAMDSSQKNYLDQALAAVQQGLSAMQAMQAQTTQAHHKYLEAQAEASRTLQQMVQSTQQLSAVFLGVAPIEASTPLRAPVALANPVSQHRPTHQEALATQPTINSTRDLPFTDSRLPQVDVPRPAGSTPAILPDANVPEMVIRAHPTDSLSQTLICIVSRLTGYPEEMLGLEMDIEADLGIDSIKRVEILSALEEDMPHLPKVTPDMVGTLKTLGQICDYLSVGGSAHPTARVLDAETGVPEDVQTQPMVVASAEIQRPLVRIVAKLTGYPEEMLGLEMDIEADLGIDSIKRVEILSALEEDMPHLPKVTPDMVGTLKTLGQICDYLSSGPVQKCELPVAPSSGCLRSHCPNVAVDTKSIGRSVVRPVRLSGSGTGSFVPAKGHSIAIVADDPVLGSALVDALGALGCDAQRCVSPEAMKPDTALAGLVLVAPMAPLQAFEWAKRCAPHLHQASRMGQALFCTVTRLDGAFGLKGGAIEAPEQGALAGLLKTAALEWPSVRCKALDIDPLWTDISAVADSIATEMIKYHNDVHMEVGLGPDGRRGLQMVPQEPGIPRALDLSAEEVVVVSGGARGVTAAAAMALSVHAPCALALLGRSPHPEQEPDWLNGLKEEAQIKQAILRHLPSNAPPTPKTLENEYRQRMANREILNTFNFFAQKGVRARYYRVDVRDTQAVAQAITTIRRELGPIKALIHGAGVLQDRLIVEKTTEQFQSVYTTKIDGLYALLAAMQGDDLSYLVLFSSISARMGNLGQADYAMANEALNKIAAQQSHLRPRCKVVSINWGPWDGGMVTPALRRSFEGNGIALIPIEQGAAAMVAELGLPGEQGVEVIIGGPVRLDALPSPKESLLRHQTNASCSSMTQAVQREIDAERCPVLQAHRLDGRPVVPLALITEWLAHGALHANPGLSLHGIDHLRLLKGITLDEPRKTIRLMAGHPKRNGALYEVDVEIRDGALNGGSVIHSSAKVILADRLPVAPRFIENGHFKTTPLPRSLKEIYHRILFHGDALQGIHQIVRLSKNGMTARVHSAPSPEKWVDDPMRSRWIADPLVLDCAFQMAIIWCHEQKGLVSLPSYADSYRQYRERFPAEGVTAIMEVAKVTERKMVADFTFLDQEKEIIASMKGYEAVMDQNLFKAFGIDTVQ
jgi:acyl transferase domain-containing protein/NAD(P)-dependent dehydrogenase (short-subunit alcohol dehydrogenase family)